MKKGNNLIKARKLYGSKKYDKALKIYESSFSQNPKDFSEWDRIFYSWSIYRVHVKNSRDENEIYDNADFITELICQANLNVKPTCAYTYSVFKIIKFLFDDRDFFNIDYWLDKIDPELLDEKSKNNKPSRKENYYRYASKTYLECGDFNECIKVSKEALNSVKNFKNHGDIWHKFWIAKALKELNRNHEAIDYLNEVILIKNDWFIKRELAENYFALGDMGNALKFVCEAVLAEGSSFYKVNFYHLIYHILKDSNPEMAIKHAELVAAIKRRRYSPIPEDLEELDIDVNNLNMTSLESEIRNYWLNFKRNQKDFIIKKEQSDAVIMEE